MFSFSFLLILCIVIIYIIKNKKIFIEENTALIELQSYIEKIKAEKLLPQINDPSLFLPMDEYIFLKEEKCYLKEPRAIRKNSGSGLGFRVAKGIYLGGYSGTSESNQEWRLLDFGNLILTNKKIVFRGEKENRTISIEKIISLKTYTDGIEIAIESKSKSTIFSVKNPYIWNLVFTLIKNGSDPLNLGEVDIDVQVK